MFKKQNLKTTLAGLASIVVGGLTVAKGDHAGGLAAVTSGLGLIFARDSRPSRKPKVVQH